MQIRVFEAFAGYGSQHLALDRLKREIPDFDFVVVGISEIDKYAISAYKAVHGDSIPNFGDIAKINWGADVPDFDLFTYSFCCQDISTAGKQAGLSEGSGTRSSLLWECKRAITEKRPKLLLMENVKALTQKKFRPDFQRWVDCLSNLGYTSYWKVLNAKDFNIPQNRERIFMVSFLGERHSFVFPEPVPLTRNLKSVLEKNVADKFFLEPKRVKSILSCCRRKLEEGCGFAPNFRTENGISNCVNTLMGCRKTDTFIVKETMPMGEMPEGNAYTITTRIGCVSYKNLLSNGLRPMTGAIECAIIGFSRDKTGKVISRHFKPFANTLTLGGGSTMQYVAETKTTNLPLNTNTDGTCRVLKTDYSRNSAQQLVRDDGYAITGVADTLIAIADKNETNIDDMLGNGKVDTNKIVFLERKINKAEKGTWSLLDDDDKEVLKFIRVRKLTPRECFRLMDVDEDAIERLLKAGISNSQLYKLAGNSIVVACLQEIFRNALLPAPVTTKP